MTQFEKLKESPLFLGLREQEIRAFFDMVHTVFQEYRDGAEMVVAGEKLKSIGILAEGSAVASKLHENGKMQILRLIEQHRVIGIETLSSRKQTAPHTVAARGNAVCAWLLWSDIEDLFRKNNDLGMRLQRNARAIIAEDMILMSYKADILSNARTEERVYAYLCVLADKQGQEDGTLHISLSFKELCEYLCLSKQGVIDGFQRLKRRGWIEKQGSVVKLLKRPAD